MAVEEKRAWIMMVVAVAAYGGYLAAVLGGTGGAPLAEAPYVTALVGSVVAAIVASIVLNILVAVLGPKEAHTKDQRDREIHRSGEYIGQSFLVIGSVTALLLAMADADQFWIANAIYLGFTLSAVLGSAAKIGAYRVGFHPW
ncbi:hypothetical protein [Kitasatospora sp. NPDC088346]|uniref:hypothetical protein n=1 Tax=Kitasatospora sp. NPDC088346 TaxID=3364073 RepID=UPI0038188D10